MTSGEETLARVLGIAVLAAVCLGIRWAYRKVAGARTIAQLPEPEDRMRHLARVRVLRRQGASLETCIADLRKLGLKKGVAQSLVLDVEREQPADVAHPKEAMWRGWSFRYPGNWRLNALVEELGEDAGITVDGVGSGMFMLIGLDGEEGALREMVAGQERQIRDPEKTPFAAWGPLRGEGTRYRGVHAKMRMPVELSIFRPADADPPFALLEWHAPEESDLVLPAFTLIRDSFVNGQRPRRP